MNRSKPVSLKKMDHRHRIMLIVIIVVFCLFVIFGWVSTVGGIFKKDATEARQQIEESIEMAEENETAENLIEDVSTIKTYFDQGVEIIQNRNEVKENVINNLKEEIEKK